MMLKSISLCIKRIFDYIFAILLSIFAIPIICIAVFFIKIVSPEAHAIFRQQRIGYRGKLFIIYKIRSMTNERDAKGNLLSDEIRLKKWGKIIRATNIDELTQIWNILKGEMSWIGPRPLLPEEMTVMSVQDQDKRQSMLPGISGWEAVNEEKTSTREAMAKYDLYYIDHWSLWLDIKIFLKTVMIIFLKLRPDDSLRAPKMTKKKEAIK